MNTKWSKNIKSVLRIVLIVLLGAILGIRIYSLNAETLVGEKMPMPFGYGAAVVLSGSMEPEMSVGDLILVKKAENFEINDIVVFQDGHSLVVHRIIEINDKEIITQGDANNTADDPIQKTDIKGTVVLCVPNAGDAVSLLKSPIGTFCIIAVAILLIEIPRRKEKKKDDEEKQKIIDEIKRLKNQK